MLSYMAFLYHGVESATPSPLDDGRNLARNCLEQLAALGDPEQFPPRLLILLASPAYLESLKSEQLLNGVLQVFDASPYQGVELMGCSAAAVFFNKRIHHRGALLICLASRLLRVRVRASPDIGNTHEQQAESLLRELNLLTEGGEEVHSFANRTLLALFPGYGVNKYLAPALHESLRRRLRARIPIFGGAASAADPRRVRSGILFANRKIYNKAIVAASVECGAPVGISLAQGLEDTGEVYRVAEVAPHDGRVIRRFKEGPVTEVMERMKESSPVPLFVNLALDRDPMTHAPVLEGEQLKLAQEAREGEPLHLLRAEPDAMRKALRKGIENSMHRAWLLNPIAALGFRCAGVLRNEAALGLELERDCAFVQSDLRPHDDDGENPYVGGFLDGEAGVDPNGSSVFSNWASTTLVFGDELRFRTPVYRGFEKLAYFAAMKPAETYKEAVDRLTSLVYDIGFPGAMLSFVLRANARGEEVLVPQSASGRRYKMILDGQPSYRLDGDDVLAAVVSGKTPRLILDSRKETCGSMRAAAEQGIVSQYVMPLTRDDGTVLATLQIDLGDISYDTQIYEPEQTVLKSLGNIISSGVHRTLSAQEGIIVRGLDRAMNECLSEDKIKQGLSGYLERALRAFGVRRGHIRIADPDERRLSLIAGVGEHYEKWLSTRRHIAYEEDTPAVRAFGDEKAIIVNDAAQNAAHLKMCDDWEGRGEETFARMLRGIGSYANIPFRGESGKLGTITLITSRPWFFTPFHEAALRALGARVGFLYETLRGKQRAWFLYGVSPQYSQINNLSRMGELLKKEVAHFAKRANAKIASLYLLDKDRGRYVLRAQFGWAKPEWVNAAYYEEDEFWTGKLALSGTSRHVPDLHAYYRDKDKDKTKDNPGTAPRYGAEAFGQELSPTFTMEAIPLEVRVAKERLGLITLYRRVKQAGESGFTTTSVSDLQQGADNLASLVSLLQSYRMEEWRRCELTRRLAVYDATVPGGNAEAAEPVERRICTQALKSYRAIKAGFYEVNSSGDSTRFDLQVCVERDPQTGRVTEAKSTDGDLKLVREAGFGNLQNEKKLFTERVEWGGDHWKDYKKSALHGLVRRACIPLISEKRLVGVLDLHWSLDPVHADSPDYQHNESYLLMLGEIIGSAYGQQRTRLEAVQKLASADETLKKSDDIVKITTTYVMDIQHELGGVIQEITNEVKTLKSLHAAGPGADMLPVIGELFRHVTDCRTTVLKMINLGSDVLDMANKPVRVISLIQSALSDKQAKCEEYKITVWEPVVTDGLFMNADRRLFNLVLGNILENAIRSMKGCDTRDLIVSAAPTPDRKNVVIAVRDTGRGMTEARLDQVRNGGLPRRRGRPHLGVRLAKMVLGIYGGGLDYDSSPGAGTEARITFPRHHTE